MNRAMTVILIAIAGTLILTLTYIVLRKPSVNRNIQPPAQPKPPKPSESTGTETNNPNMSEELEEDSIITVTIPGQNEGEFDVYSFDKDANAFMPGDTIFSLENTVMINDDNEEIEVSKMQPLGIFVNRDITGFYVNNNGNIYKIPGLNENSEIAKLIIT